MEQRRLITFMLTASLIMLGYLQLQLLLNPPQPPAEVAEQADALPDAQQDVADRDEPAAAGSTDVDAPPPAAVAAEVTSPTDFAGDRLEDEAPEPLVSLQRHVLGSLDPTSPYQVAVTFSNQGAAIERIELNDPHYQELDEASGYLGHLSLTDAETGGCVIDTVASGTPAALATCIDGGAPMGLQGTLFEMNDKVAFPARRGDRIVGLNDLEIADAASFQAALRETRPKQTIALTVMREDGNGTESRLRFETELTKHPLSVVAPEYGFDQDQAEADQLSFLCTFGKLSDAKVGLGKDEINGLPSLWKAPWKVALLEDGNGIEFRRRLTTAEVAERWW